MQIVKAASNLVFGQSAEDASQELRVLKKSELRSSVDVISSLAALAGLVNVPKGSLPKISLGEGRFYAKTMEQASKEWVGETLTSILPSYCQRFFQHLDRTVNRDSRQYLDFYNTAIPLAHKLYPTNSMNDHQNKLMKNFWSLVLQGIEVLETSYDKELSKFIFPEATVDVDKIEGNADGKDPFDEYYLKLKEGETIIALERKKRIDDTFNAWRTAIEGYKNLKQEDQRFADLIPTINDQTEPKKHDNVEQEKKEEVNEEVNNVANEVEKQATIDSLLAKLHVKLKTFNRLKLEEEDSKIIQDLLNIVELTVLNGSVPRKVNPFINKLRNLWDIDAIEWVVTNIELISKKTSNFQRQAALENIETFLQQKAVRYIALIDQDQEENIALDAPAVQKPAKLM